MGFQTINYLVPSMPQIGLEYKMQANRPMACLLILYLHSLSSLSNCCELLIITPTLGRVSGREHFFKSILKEIEQKF